MKKSPDLQCLCSPRTGDTQLCVGDNIDIHANIGIRDASAGYHVAAEFQGVEVGASATAHISSIDIYFEVMVTSHIYRARLRLL